MTASRASTHLQRISRLVRDAVANNQISPAWQVPILVRHYASVDLPAPGSLYHDMVDPYVIGTLTTFPGNTIVDQHGFATATLRDMMPELPYNFSIIVRRMEKAGFVSRQHGTGGRRTTSITATPAGIALLGEWLPHQPAPDDIWLGDYKPKKIALAPVVTLPPMSTSDHDIDATSLSRLCLRLGIERDEWAGKFFQAEANIDKLVARMADQETELQELRRRLDNATPAYDSANPNVALRARLTDDERASLDRLMREVPTG